MASRDHRLSSAMLALGLALSGGAALGQASERAWTDPPARTSAPLASPPAAPGGDKAQALPQAPASARVRVSDDAPRRAKQSRARPGHVAVAHRRIGTSRPSVRFAGRAAPGPRHATRLQAGRSATNRPWTARAYQPSFSEDDPIRYGEVDDTAARIRRAQESGFLVVRAGDLRALRDRRFEAPLPTEYGSDPED